jgi:minichromosome maintenance protein 10
LVALHSSRKQIELGPRPGQRIRSGVFAPPNRTDEILKAASGDDAGLQELDREATPSKVLASPVQMVDLDASSDVE